MKTSDLKKETDKLTVYLMNGLELYAEKKPIDRRILMATIAEFCKMIFTSQTPFSIKEQCEEIDMFCEFLKNHALQDAIRS